MEKLFYFLNLFSIRFKSFPLLKFLSFLCLSLLAQTLRIAENPESFSSHSFFIFSHRHSFGWYEKWNIKRYISKSISIVVHPSFHPFQFYTFFSSKMYTIFFSLSLRFFCSFYSFCVRFVSSRSMFLLGWIISTCKRPKSSQALLLLSLARSASICFY